MENLEKRNGKQQKELYTHTYTECVCVCVCYLRRGDWWDRGEISLMAQMRAIPTPPHNKQSRVAAEGDNKGIKNYGIYGEGQVVTGYQWIFTLKFRPDSHVQEMHYYLQFRSCKPYQGRTTSKGFPTEGMNNFKEKKKNTRGKPKTPTPIMLSERKSSAGWSVFSNEGVGGAGSSDNTYLEILVMDVQVLSALY